MMAMTKKSSALYFLVLAISLHICDGQILNTKNLQDWDEDADYIRCGQTSDEDVIMLTNPYYPSGTRNGTVCNYYIAKSEHHVTQFRVEFIYFTLAPPTGDGFCTRDYISVEADSLNVPRLCGDLSGQHYYIHIPKIPKYKRFFRRRHGHFLPLNIKIALSSSFAYTRRWKIRVIQVSHHRRRIDHIRRLRHQNDVLFRAPTNCLQYFTNSSGNIQSFNYKSDTSGQFNSLGIVGSRQIANLNYTICVKQDFFQCSIVYSIPSSDPYAFTLTGDVTSVDPTILGSSALQVNTCTTDYISIPGQTQLVNGVWTALSRNTSCGMGFVSKLSERYLSTCYIPGGCNRNNFGSTKPFTIQVVTDANETPDIANRGFFLNYRQQTSCT